MPERHILQRRNAIRTHHTRQPGQILREHRVALVRHRGATFLAFREKLLSLQHFRALEVAHFRGHILNRRGDDGQRGKIRRMAVTGNNLRRDWLWLQAQLCGDMLFHLRRNIGKSAHCTGNGAGCDLRAGLQKTLPVALELRMKAGELQPHRHRFSMYAVAPANRNHVLGFKCPFAKRRQHPVHTAEQQVGSLHQLHGKAGIEHIGTGHPLMHKARIFANMLCQMGEKRDDIMFGGALDFINTRNVELLGCILPDIPGRLLGDDAQLS